jgi:putative hydrolase of the HAD superfamily
MVRTLLFDIGEVLITGLYGIRIPLPARLELSEEAVLEALWSPVLHDLLCGRATEEEYLDDLLLRTSWPISREDLRHLIRQTFDQPVAGMEPLVERLLSRDYELALVSDHAVEWIEYIFQVHPFLGRFERRFYSFQSGRTKEDPVTFERVLSSLGRAPADCVFIDDLERNVASAQSVGIPSIRFLSADALRGELAQRGVRTEDVAKPLRPRGILR